MINVAINGFGRIGRAAFKIAMGRDDINVVAINDPHDPEMLSYMLRYDTVYGRYDKEVTLSEGAIIVDGHKVALFADRNPANLPWGDLNVDVVIEATGVFRTRELALVHVEKAGAKAVIITAPAKGGDDVPTYVQGANDDSIEGVAVSSNASCTTNCIAPVMSLLNTNFGVAKSLMTTIHSYTAGQNLVDGNIKGDPRRGRAAAQNIVPTTTGAAKATAVALPDLEGKFDGISIRVPTPVVSLSDITVLLEKDVTVEDVNNMFIEATKTPSYKNILSVTSEPLVSSDFIGSPYSAIIDLSMTKVVGGNLLKVIAWYDNEWGYSERLVDMVGQVGKKLV